jgi:hypothetical protein
MQHLSAAGGKSPTGQLVAASIAPSAGSRSPAAATERSPRTFAPSTPALTGPFIGGTVAESSSSRNDVLDRRHNRGITWLELAVEFAEETVEHGPSAYVAPDTVEAIARVLLALVAERKVIHSEIPSLKQVIADMLPYLSSVWDEGPEGEGWKSDKLRGVIARAEEAIK